VPAENARLINDLESGVPQPDKGFHLGPPRWLKSIAFQGYRGHSELTFQVSK
jgi:hypothetical protein